MGGVMPTGTLTFLFTDVVGSTWMWEADPAVMGSAMARHDELVDSVVTAAGGRVVRPRGEGDSQFVVFADAGDALRGAGALLCALSSEPWPTSKPLRVRAAIHGGEAEFRADDY